MVVYVLRKEQFTELAALASCVQITCFLLLSIISACILLQTKHRYRERIDAIGAWLVIHIFNMVGNISILLFELWPRVSNLWATSIPLTILICWKGVFIVIEMIGLPYTFFIMHKTVRLLTPKIITQHPLFSEHELANMNQSHTSNNPHQPVYDREDLNQISVISSTNERIRVPHIYQDLQGNTHRQYESYMSLSSNTGRQYLPYNGQTGQIPFTERYPRVLPDLPIGKVKCRNNEDNMGYSNDAEIDGTEPSGTLGSEEQNRIA